MKYKDDGDEDAELVPGDAANEDSGEKSLPVEFSDKTNQLLEYIEKTYLKGMVRGGDGKNIMDKMRLAENSQKVTE